MPTPRCITPSARVEAAWRCTTPTYKHPAGTGALRHQLDDETVTLGIEDKVIFTGFLSNPLALVDHADCFVLASDIEGQPITVLESLVLGQPVIASDIAGPRGLLARGEGTLVEPTAEAFAEAMRRFASGESGSTVTFDAELYVEEALDEFTSLLPSS